MLIDVIKVIPKDNYLLHLTFEKEFDCKHLLEWKVYEPLKDIEFFKKAHVKYGTVVWDENIDIAPESLYLESREVN